MPPPMMPRDNDRGDDRHGLQPFAVCDEGVEGRSGILAGRNAQDIVVESMGHAVRN
jgi:hypothetical protein